MKLSQMIEADKVINRFMGNRSDTDVRYWDSWDQLMKVTKQIFKKYEDKDTEKMCELLRYALYWNDFPHVYATTVLVIKHYGTSSKG